MSKYKACIFDFDLTLADSSKGILMCFKRVLADFGYPIPDDKIIYDTIGMTLLDAFDLLTGITPNPQREVMRQTYIKYADEYMVKNTVFYDDAIAVLQTLQHAGIKVGIVSTKLKYRILDSFKQQAGSFPVDEVIGGGEVRKAKPDPEGLNKMIKLLNVDKIDALYVGDSYIDAQTAQNAEVDFAGVTTGSTTESVFKKYPHIYIGKSLVDIFTSI